MNKLTRMIALIAVIVLSSCDKIDAPYFDDIITGPTDTTQFVRKVLVEDYTGHTCGNCPKAAEEADAIAQLYGNKVVLMAVHAGFFAVPAPPAPLPSGAPTGSFATDFRTTAGDIYDGQQYFGISNIGNPNGMVNRKKVNNNYVVSYTNWGAQVAALLATAPQVGTNLSADYNTTTRTANITLTTRVLSPLTSSFKVVACITESNIITWQRDDRLTNRNVPDYNHKHILRANINGTWGDDIVSASNAVGTDVTTTFTYSLPANFNENNCSVVIYIYDTTSLEVIQADEVKLK